MQKSIGIYDTYICLKGNLAILAFRGFNGGSRLPFDDVSIHQKKKKLFVFAEIRTWDQDLTTQRPRPLGQPASYVS